MIALELGFYTNKDGEQKETVIIKPISLPPTATTGNGNPDSKPESSLREDLSDDLPY